MKRRLLFLFAVFMVATSVGWGQTDLYVSTSGSDSNGGGSGSPLATIAKAIEKATDGATIHVAEGIYPQVSPIVVAKSITIIGSDSTNCIIEGQLDIQRDGEESVIDVNLRNLQITKGTTLSQGLINVMSKNVNLNLSGVHLHQLTAGTGDGWGKSSMGIVNLGKNYDSNSICDNVNVSLTNSCIYLEGSYNRGFSSFGNTTKVKNTIVLDNSHILSAVYPKNGTYSRGISFSNMNGSSIEMKNNSTIKGFYYAINVTVLNDNLSISIVDSKIDSWAALNIWSSNNKFKITNSTLESHNYQLKGTNDFATIVLNKDEEDNAINNSFDIKNTNLFAFMESTALQYPISARSTGNTFNIGEGSVLKVNKNDVGVLIQENTLGSNIFNCDNTIEYKIADDKSAITVFNQDGSLRNAACDLSSLLSEVDLTDQNRIVFPEGEYTLPTTLSLDKSITLQGAGQSETIVNGHIFVNSPSGGSVTLTASDMTLKGTDNSSPHGLIGMIGTGKDVVKLTNCKLDGGSVTAQTAAVGVRMESVGADLSLTDTDIDVNYYGIGVRNMNQSVTINGGTLIGWAGLMTSAGGLSQGDGSIANTNTRITAKSATFISRTLLNGKSNSYGAVIFQEKYNGVTADFKKCELRAVDGLTPLVHATQATATDIRSYGNNITFTDCTLSSLGGTNNLLDGSGGYLHAGVIRLGWHGTDDNSQFANNTITINSSTLNGKEGENWIYSHRKKETKIYDKLTINGTVYDPASGLICYGEPDIQSKIENAIAGETISVPEGEHEGFNVTTADIRIKGVYGKTIIKGAKQYTGSSVACVSADKVTLMNLSFMSSTDESNRPTGLFVDGGTVNIDSCIFEDKLLQTGLYSEPGSTLEDATLLVQNSRFNVFDKNLLISAGRLNATVKNNVFEDSDISVAKNDGSNVVESNEFHNCVVKVEDGVTFQYNKMYPGDQTYVYSIRPNDFEGTVDASNNYWGSDNPDFSALIDKSKAEKGSVDYFPYYSDVALGTLIYKMVTISEDTVWATPHPNQKVTVLDGATLTLSAPMSLDTVTMREGAQIKSNLADQTGSVTTKSLRFSPDLSGTEWKAFGMPFASAVINNSKEEKISKPSQQSADKGIWFARLKDNKTPEFVVDESAFGMAGLWAANGDTYTISSKGTFEFKTSEEPAAPTETGTFLMCSNPNTFTITLKQSAYILTADGTSFEQEANPEIKPFQSFVLTDAKTLSTLRSLRIGDSVVTGNQTIEPVDGYYVTTDRGAIVIHTPEPMDVVIIGMNGKVAYRGEATDGRRIMVPSGIYAVNGQLVRVK